MRGAVAGVDLGASHVAVRFIDADGHYLDACAPLPRFDEGAHELDWLAAWLRTEGARVGEISAAGVAAAPTIDHQGIVQRWPNRAQWAGLPIAAALRDALRAPIRFLDDGTAAAKADAEALQVKDLVHLAIGSGVGGGLVLGGVVYTGRDGGAGELGHVVIQPDGPRCSCGRGGCLQALTGGDALADRLGVARGDSVAEHIRQGLALSDPLIRAVFDEASEALALALINLTEVIEPEVVTIGGGLGVNLPELAGAASTRASAWARGGRQIPPVRLSPHGPLAALVGATLVGRELASSQER